MRQHRKTIFAIFAVVIIILTVALHIPDSLIDYLDQSGMIFWAKVISGNWAPENPPGSVTKYQQSIATVVAVLLNNGVIFVMFLYVWNRLTKERTKYMRLTQALALKDTALKQVLYKKFEADKDTMNLIKSCFNEASENWKSSLKRLLGEKDASEVISSIEKTEISVSQNSKSSP